MKANRIVLLSLLMLSILVSGCGTSAPNSSETYESTIVETTETIQMPEAVYEFPVMVSEDRGLTISLHLEELEDFSAKEIRKIEVYDGDQLLQTITKDDIPEVTDYGWDGLFLNESNTIGLPDVRDLNFDGAEDFGLLAVFAYPQNVPYSYFFWNAEKALFEYQLTAFGPGWLQIDDSEKCLVEVSNEGMETYKKYFSFDLDGNIVTENQTTSENSNGDVGYVTSISGTQTDSVVRIDFGDGRIVDYENGDLDMLDLGYACTIHKSQGSEYKSVIINLQCAHSVMLVRPLIYTAITRAKERVLIVGERRALCTAIRRTDTEQRGTKLAKRIQDFSR